LVEAQHTAEAARALRAQRADPALRGVENGLTLTNLDAV
jgi:hypothetical protein